MNNSEDRFKLLGLQDPFNYLVEISPDPIYIIRNDEFIFVNKAWLELFEYKESEVLEKKFFYLNIVAPESQKLIQTKIKNPPDENSKSTKYQFACVSKSGKRILIEAIVYGVKIGETIAHVGIYRNLTEINDEIEKLSALKSGFLAQISHEIRTPINVILNFMELLKIDNINDIADTYEDELNIVESASRRIIRTIDLILNMSEMQSGTYKGILKELDLHKDVIVPIYNEMQGFAKSKKLDINIKLETQRTKLIADEYSLQQIFQNLIFNAIKYTSEGSISIIIKKNEAGKLQTMIEDTGVGISKEFIPRLFQPFSQEETGYTRRFEGNGLGLALVKKYCDINKIAIEVKTKKNLGTTFILNFPD
ncbi:MAG: PAS domain-containing sensor histidine kinase [Melioribacteraceae bacterium]|nr:PAS domain-containing sensor histidine kinase [Melioribacteraceae bacterium]